MHIQATVASKDAVFRFSYRDLVQSQYAFCVVIDLVTLHIS